MMAPDLGMVDLKGVGLRHKAVEKADVLHKAGVKVGALVPDKAALAVAGSSYQEVVLSCGSCCRMDRCSSG